MNRIVKRTLGGLAAAAAAAAPLGCASSGLSYGESGPNSQANYLATMVAAPDSGITVGTTTRPAAPLARRPFAGPARLAVAQVGEVAPPEAMLAPLRDARGLFTRVDTIPAVGDGVRVYSRPDGDAGRQAVRERIDALRALARSVGSDYLLLVGGSADTSRDSTPLSVLNLTIVGLFIVPSERVQATMKASGALIDVSTGQVVSLSSAQLFRERLSPMAASDGDLVRLLGKMRDDVTADLAGKVIAACRADEDTAASARR